MWASPRLKNKPLIFEKQNLWTFFKPPDNFELRIHVWSAVESERICMHRSTSVLKYGEVSHQLFGFLWLLPRLCSLSLHRSSDVLMRCLSLLACDASQLLLYNGLLLFIPAQTHTLLYWLACCQAMIQKLQFLLWPLGGIILSTALICVLIVTQPWTTSRKIWVLLLLIHCPLGSTVFGTNVRFTRVVTTIN